MEYSPSRSQSDNSVGLAKVCRSSIARIYEMRRRIVVVACQEQHREGFEDSVRENREREKLLPVIRFVLLYREILLR